MANSTLLFSILLSLSFSLRLFVVVSLFSCSLMLLHLPVFLAVAILVVIVVLVIVVLIDSQPSHDGCESYTDCNEWPTKLRVKIEMSKIAVMLFSVLYITIGMCQIGGFL